MAGARASVELFAQAFDQHPGDCAIGINLFDRRRKEDIHALFLQQPAVAVELARILRQVFCRAELCGVHKNRNGNRVALRLCGADQRQVAFMQSAHRWNETEAFGVLAADGGTRLGNSGADVHGKRSAKALIASLTYLLRFISSTIAYAATPFPSRPAPL